LTKLSQSGKPEIYRIFVYILEGQVKILFVAHYYIYKNVIKHNYIFAGREYVQMAFRRRLRLLRSLFDIRMYLYRCIMEIISTSC